MTKKYVPRSVAMINIVNLAVATALYVNSCNNKHYTPLLEQASKIEEIVIKDSLAYSVNGLGQSDTLYSVDGISYMPHREGRYGLKMDGR